MNLFKIFGTIGINGAEESKKALKDVSGEGEQTSSKLGNAFSTIGKGAVAVGKTIATGIGAGSVAIAKIGKESITAYADYEQLIGGVETLFKDSAGIIQDYADVAYETAGLSANEYMSTVTSFSASLLQSLNGDTKKSAETANQAIIDMSDNANKMGTSMESIQNAYQGFAKQNYTMLDNLKLGYGGTKEEMERLLEDASKISGIEYDLSSFADITEAIHVVQTEMGITGTTAKEASTTIQGSIGSMKSSFQNLLTSLSADGWDVGVYIENFVATVETAIGNIIPRITAFLPNLIEGIEYLIELALPIVVNLIQATLPTLIKGAVSLLNSLVSQLPTIIQVLISDALPILIEGVIQIFIGILNQLPTIIQMLTDSIPVIVEAIVTALLGDNLSTIIDSVIAIAIAIVDSADKLITTLVPMIPVIVVEIAGALIRQAPKLISACLTIVGKLAGTIKNWYSSWVSGFGKAFEKIVAPVKNAIDKIKGFFKNLKLELPKIKLPHFKLTGSFSLNPPSVPKLGVEWYKKAMADGMIMNQPTIFGYNPQTGNAMAGGEAGSETVVGTNNLLEMIQKSVASAIEQLNIDLYLDGDTLVGGTAQRMNDKLGQLSVIRRRGVTV